MPTESVALQDITGRVLASPTHAPINLPNFTNSAVDGFAIRCEDAGAQLNLAGQVAAGEETHLAVARGQTIRVFTGSAIPPGANAVVMQEDVTLEGNQIRVNGTVEKDQHIRFEGEELRRGDKVFDPGIVVNPAVLGALSTLGFSRFDVFTRPKVSVLGTGSELVPPGTEISGSQVYESNTHAISSAVSLSGASVTQLSRARDDLEEIKHQMARGLNHADALITCGGVSVGEHDHIRSVAAELGVREIFWRVAMRPGRPTYFGLSPGGQPVFGLPGNPVSALIVFFVLVRPAILKMTGLDPSSFDERAILGESIRKQKGRMEFARAAVANGIKRVAFPTKGQGSHMITGLANATHILHLPADKECLDAGEEVVVTRFQWGLC